MRRPTLNLIGYTFGQLTVMHRSEGKGRYWTCKCSCGASTDVRADHLRSGAIRSCSCGRVTNGQNVGGKQTPTYKSWLSMKARCKDFNNQAYGGRGITYDPRWELFEHFLEDVGVRPPGTTLDRLDAFKGYFKQNCQWGDKAQQARNKRGTLWYTYDRGGPFEMTATAPEWANTLTRLTLRIWTSKDFRFVLKLIELDRLINAYHPHAPSSLELEDRRKKREEEDNTFVDA